MSKNLPRPVSTTDFYLAAILDELRSGGQVATDGDDAGPIELREPEAHSTPLPLTLPGRDALLAAGIETLENVPRTGKRLTAVSGIGKVTANQILTWLKAGQ